MDYREALLLRAARETGLLDAVTTDAGTPAEVAESTDVTERAARIVLDALAELGYLAVVGDEQDRYEPTNEALGFLATADVRSIGSAPLTIDSVEFWLQLPETMRTGEPPELHDDWTEHYMGGMADRDAAGVRASVTAAVHRNPDAERVLDAGGGPGTVAKEFARRGFDVTLLDRPDVIEIDRRFLEHEPIELVAGDVTEGLPTAGNSDGDRFDIVFCSRVAHALGRAGTREFVANAYDALNPGGALVLTDFVRGRADEAALFGAHVFAMNGEGETYTEAQFTDWLTDAGFEDVEVRDVPGVPDQVIAGRRPVN
ncbi:class I SAM-dependent methyltransferase [Halorussus litoreus]|uniref:class I SAM-dependent methyltransferase n=1 Tax=Halorussus litoreus TaxID=1710536 RepID=UPI000E286712|nr:class I SAM-dependent methyltransferase [Halorussus litoreus]